MVDHHKELKMEEGSKPLLVRVKGGIGCEFEKS